MVDPLVFLAPPPPTLLQLLFGPSFKYSSAKQWLSRWAPLLFPHLVLLYLLLIVFLLPTLLPPLPQHSSRRSLRLLLALWNVLLALFSFLGFVRIIPTLINVIRTKGIGHSYAQLSDLQTHPIAGYWVFLWVLSKVPELVDSVFLVLKRKPLRFMHWFHHAMSIAFGSINYAFGDNAYLAWVAAMNFFIHALMYSYYAATSLGVSLPRSIAQLITSLQMIQFLVILLQLGHVFVLHFLLGSNCAISLGGLAIGTFSTAIYMKLWIPFFKEQYLAENNNKSDKQTKKR